MSRGQWRRWTYLYQLEDDIYELTEKPLLRWIETVRITHMGHDQQRMPRGRNCSRDSVVVRTLNLAQQSFVDGELFRVRIEDLDNMGWVLYVACGRRVHVSLFSSNVSQQVKHLGHS